jgi:hypothetical protein
LLDSVEATAREVSGLIIVEAARRGPGELEMGEGDGEERKRKDSSGEHIDGCKW